MSTTSGRMLQVLSLLQSRGEWSGPELADRLGVTERTVRRDVDRLRRLGYTVDSTTGSTGGYRLGFGTGMPPLLLTADEAVAVAVALRSAAVAGLEGIDEAAIQALIKLEQSIPAALRQRVEAIQRAVLAISGPGPALDPEVLTTVATAIRDQRRLRADYVTHRGVPLSRLLEPHRVVRVVDRWFLLAWDTTADDWRTLRLDRLTPRPPLGGRFDPRPLDDAAVSAAVSDGITSRPYRYRTRLTAFAPADVVGEAVGATRARVVAMDARTSEITGGGDELRAMALWILSLPFPVAVHEPAELLPYLDEVATNARAAASGMRPPG